MRRALPLIALLATLPLAGCTQAGTKNTDSTKDFTGDQKAVASTVEDLQTAAKDRKGTTICADLITAELRDKISTSDCPKVMKDAVRDTDEVDLKVKTVKVTRRHGGRVGAGEDRRRRPDAHDRAAEGRRALADLRPAAGLGPQPPWNWHTADVEAA